MGLGKARPPSPLALALALALSLALALALLVGCAGSSNSSAAPNVGGEGTGGADVDGGITGGMAGAGAGTGGVAPPPETELDSTYQVPVATGRFVWIANPTSGRVAYVDAQSLAVTTVEAGDAPTTIAAVPDARGGDQVIVLNVLSHDATVLRADGTTLESRTIPGVTSDANRLVVSPGGRFAIAWTDGRALTNVRATQGFQSLTVIDLAATGATPSHTTLAVGFRPVSVSFSSDERRAFAVTEDGVSILTLDGAGGPLVGASVALGDDPTASADTRDVSITADGRFAIVRREGSDTVSIVDLGSGALAALRLGGAVTDVDLTGDGRRVVAVARDASEVAVIPLAAALPAAADVVHVTITGETIGQAVLTADGATAVLYSNAVASERVTVLALGPATPTWRTLRVHAPVLSVALTPDGHSAVVLHAVTTDAPAAPGSGAGGAGGPAGTPAAGAFSLLPLDGTHPALIQTTDAPIQAIAFAPAGDRVLLTVRDDRQAIFGVYLGLFPTLEVRRYPLASPPIAAGIAVAAGRGYVAQQHAEGRITFITLDSGEARTLTGYELGARVVDWSKP
jgi:DNA-binding beta-propeller fold protein YncE